MNIFRHEYLCNFNLESMVKALTINRQISPNSHLPRIGGNALLPLELD